MLGLREGAPPSADVASGGVLVVILGVGAGRARQRLRPEVARIGRRAARLQGDEVVLFIGARWPSLAVLLHLGGLERFVNAAGGRMALVQPGTQIVLWMVACVTSGLRAPGVQRMSARPSTTWQLAGTTVAEAGVVGGKPSVGEALWQPASRSPAMMTVVIT